MELAVVDISVQPSSLDDIQPTLVPMEVESEILIPQIQENPQKELESTQCVENNESNEPETEAVPTEEEDNDNETKENILKGILKHEHIYGLDKKSVDFDMDIEMIPYDNQDYTVEIQIVKELPKKIVSYRELFKKMAEEEKNKGKEDKPEEDEEEEAEPEDTKSFNHLVLKEPPIHHSTNDIDVNSYKTLKAITGQNEKNEDSPNICPSNASPKEEENNPLQNQDISHILDKSKLSHNPVDEFIEFSSNPKLDAPELTEKLDINKNNTLVNGDLNDFKPHNQITQDDQSNRNNGNITSDMERNNSNARRSRQNNVLARRGRHRDVDDEVDESFFDCGHDYIYSDYNEDDFSVDEINSMLERDEDVSNGDVKIKPEISITSSDQKEDMDIENEGLNNEESQNNIEMTMKNEDHCISQNNNNIHQENQNHILASHLKDSKHLNVDINYVNGPTQDKHHQVKLESIKEEKSFNSSKEDTDEISNRTVENERSRTPLNEIETNTNTISTGELNTSNLLKITDDIEIKSNGEVKEETRKMDKGVQTDFFYPLHCQCACTGSKANEHERNMERFQNATIPSLNSDENIAMLASDVELDCQEDKSTTDSTEGNFRDFTQSTSLDCSTSLSMESFEMDDNSLRIDTVNGLPSNDVSM